MSKLFFALELAATLCSHCEGTNQPERYQALFCSAHKEPDMINVNIRDRQCAMPECANYPSYNFPGSKGGLYCGAWSLLFW